jgi:hypothetical protein
LKNFAWVSNAWPAHTPAPRRGQKIINNQPLDRQKNTFTHHPFSSKALTLSDDRLAIFFLTSFAKNIIVFVTPEILGLFNLSLGKQNFWLF